MMNHHLSPFVWQYFYPLFLPPRKREKVVDFHPFVIDLDLREKGGILSHRNSINKSCQLDEEEYFCLLVVWKLVTVPPFSLLDRGLNKEITWSYYYIFSSSDSLLNNPTKPDSQKVKILLTNQFCEKKSV